jgi:hypothetical protein
MTDPRLLLEDGSFFLLESGGRLTLEGLAVGLATFTATQSIGAGRIGEAPEVVHGGGGTRLFLRPWGRTYSMTASGGVAVGGAAGYEFVVDTLTEEELVLLIELGVL